MTTVEIQHDDVLGWYARAFGVTSDGYRTREGALEWAVSKLSAELEIMESVAESFEVELEVMRPRLERAAPAMLAALKAAEEYAEIIRAHIAGINLRSTSREAMEESRRRLKEASRRATYMRRKAIALAEGGE